MKYISRVRSYVWATLLLFFIVLPDSQAQDQYLTYHKKLHKKLLNGYEKSLRPANSPNDTLDVHVGLTITSFDDLDEERQMLAVTGWIRQFWTDFQLTWDPKDYGGIKRFELPVTDIWYPDINVDNRKDVPGIIPTEHNMVIIRSSGLVSWVQSVHIRSSCPIDLTHFPYDQHICNIYLASWTYDEKKLNLLNYNKNITNCRGSTYMKSNAWSIDDCVAGLIGITYAREEGDVGTYPVLAHNVTITRVSSLASHLFVLPSVSLAFVTILTFVLPAASREKIILGVGILISDVLLLGELIRYVPAAHPTLPLIGKYFLANIMLVSLSLFASVGVINMWARSTARINGPPNFIRLVMLDYLAKWLFVTEDQFCDSLDDVISDSQDDSAGDSIQQISADTSNKTRLRQAQIYVRKIVKLQWRQLATVVDRLLLIIYSLIIFILTLMFAQYM